MKISLNWLNDYLGTPVAQDAVDDLLTGHGFPIEDTVTIDQGPAGTGSGGGDVMFDVEVTSNRGDCLSHVGVAREVAAATGSELIRPSTELPAARSDAVEALTSVTHQEADACPLYTARVITGVKIGPSPNWLVAKLEAVGLRSVNNVVDVTNFVLLELGQPLHAFDLGKLAGRQVVVRRAAKGEKFNAIDGTKHELRDDMLVIADAERPQAVAGVMGGADSEVGDDTTDILLESAIFEPLSVRKTSRALKLASDSSFRFERGVDPVGVGTASRRAAALIVELAGGTLADGVIRVGPMADQENEPVMLSLRAGRCRQLLGLDLSAEQQADYLNRIGLNAAADGETVTAMVPTFRLDLTREVDLIEEIARLHGMDAIPIKPKLELIAKPPQASVKAKNLIGDVLVAHGYHETITFSFINPKLASPFLPEGAEALMLEGDHKKDEPMLRPSVLPSLLQCRKLNQDAGNADVRLFESASTWNVIDGQTVETVKLALLRDAKDADEALRELRGAIDEVVEALGGVKAKQAVQILTLDHPGEFATAGQVVVENKAIGILGLVADKTRDRFDVQTPQAAAELDLAGLLELYPPTREVGALPKFPGIERDLSVIVEERVSWAQVESAVVAAEPAMLEDLAFLGVYRGKPIAAGKKSVSLRMRFRDPATTLRHEQVDPQVAAVTASLAKAVGAELRG
ncbi:MAG: phenylalanine--tRNA ligase subunit beta [Planctomycetota bacterium]